MKSKGVATLLAIFLGFLGVHHFYLGNRNRGFVYLGIFALSVLFLVYGIGIVGVIALIVMLLFDIINLLAVDERKFNRMYNSSKPSNNSGKIAA